MNVSDKSYIRINGKKFLTTYKGRAGDSDAAGWGFSIIDIETEKPVGFLRVLIYGTASAMWHNHTRLTNYEQEAEKVVRSAIDAVISTLNFNIAEDYMESMSYRGDAITVQITTLDNAVSEKGALVTLKSYNSPEEFVSKHLFGESNDPAKIRNAILVRLNKWEELNYGLPYSTKDIQSELLLSRTVTHRSVDYLSGPGLSAIAKSSAGDDEYNLKLNPSGVDYVESLIDINSSTNTMMTQVNLEQSIYAALYEIDQNLGRSYEQVVSDINDENRKSWKGTANEIREVVSGLLRKLAPDDLVVKQSSYVQDKQSSGPTQKQRAKFILEKRSAGSKELEVANSIGDVEDRIAAFVRKFYDRASTSAHNPAERKEIIKIHGYLVAFLRDLLDIE